MRDGYISVFFAIALLGAVAAGARGITEAGVPQSPPVKIIHDPQPISNRIKRDPQNDVFTSKVDQLAMAARVVSAIGLRVGLADGSITIDEAIAELINIAPVKMGDLATFDKKMVDAFFEKIEKLTVKNVDTLENGIVAMDEWTTEFAKLDDFEKNIKPYSEMIGMVPSIPPRGFYGVTNNIGTIVNTLGNIPTLPDNPPSDAQALQVHVRKLKTLQSVLNDYNDLEIDLNELSVNVNNLKSLGDENQIKHYRFAQLVKQLPSSNTQQVTNEESDLKEMFKKTAELRAEFDAVKKDVDIVSAIVSAMNVVEKVAARQHTAGLIHGFNDLLNISADVQNPWMVSTFPGFDANRIVSGLTPFAELSTDVENYVYRWKRITDAAVHISVQVATPVLESFDDVSAAAVDGFSKVKECLTYTGKAPDVIPSFEKAIELRKKYNDAIRSLDTLKSVPVSLKGMKDHLEVRKLIKFSDNETNHNAEYPEVIKRLKAFPKTEELIRIIKETEAPLKNFEKALKAIQDDAEKINADQSNVDKFFNDPSIAKLKTFFGCTKSISAEVAVVSKAIGFIDKLRDMQSTKGVANNVKIATAVIAESALGYPNLQETAATRGEVSANALPELAPFKNTSKPFGDGVVLLTTIRRVLEKKKSFDVILEKSPSVDRAIANMGNGKLKVKVVKAWGNSDEMRESVRKMMETVKKATSATRRRRQASGLSSFGELFSALATLEDVKLDAARSLEAVRSMISSATAKDLEHVRDALQDIRYLDLKFSAYQSTIAEMPSTLADIETTFATATQRAADAKAKLRVEFKRVKKNYGAAALFYLSVIPGYIFCIAIVVVVCKKAKEYAEYDKNFANYQKMKKKKDENKKRRSQAKKKRKSKNTKKKGKKSKNTKKTGKKSKNTKKTKKSKPTKKGPKKGKKSRQSAGKQDDIAAIQQPISLELSANKKCSVQDRRVKRHEDGSSASRDSLVAVRNDAPRAATTTTVVSSNDASRIGPSARIESSPTQLTVVQSKNMDKFHFKNNKRDDSALDNSPEFPLSLDCVQENFYSDDSCLQMHDYSDNDVASDISAQSHKLHKESPLGESTRDIRNTNDLHLIRALACGLEGSNSVDFLSQFHCQNAPFSDAIPNKRIQMENELPEQVIMA